MTKRASASTKPKARPRSSGLARTTRVKPPEWKLYFLQHAGIAGDMPSDGSVEHDHYLYGVAKASGRRAVRARRSG